MSTEMLQARTFGSCSAPAPLHDSMKEGACHLRLEGTLRACFRMKAFLAF